MVERGGPLRRRLRQRKPCRRAGDARGARILPGAAARSSGVRSRAAPPAYDDCAAGAVCPVAHPARYAGAESPRPVTRHAGATQRRALLGTRHSAMQRVPNAPIRHHRVGQRGRRGERDWAAACVTGGAARDRTPDARAAAPGGPVASRWRPRSAVTRLARCPARQRIPHIGEEPIICRRTRSGKAHRRGRPTRVSNRRGAARRRPGGRGNNRYRSSLRRTAPTCRRRAHPASGR